MFSFRKSTAFILLYGFFSLTSSFTPIMKEIIVPSLKKMPEHIFYANATYYFDSNENLPISFIQILGAKIRYLQYFNGPTSDKMLVRSISRSKYSLRLKAPRQWLCFSIATLKLIQNQSWYSVWWNGFDHTNESCKVFISTAGPCVDTTTGTFSDGMTELKKFFLALNKAVITEAEVLQEKQELANWSSEKFKTLTKQDVIEQIWNGGTKLAHLYENIMYNVPLPLTPFITIHISDFDLDNANNYLEEWRSSPLEILVVGDKTETTDNLITETYHLASLIKQKYQVDSYLSENFSNIASLAMQNVPWIPMIYFTFGNLSADTLIAAEMTKRAFSYLVNGNIKYASDWTIRGGCIFFIVKMYEENNPGLIEGNHAAIMQDDVNKVRQYFEQLNMENSLATGGELETARTIGPHLKSFMAPDAFPAGKHAFTNAMDWLTESLEGERAFEELNELNMGLENGSMNMTFLTDNLKMILMYILRTDDPSISSYYSVAGAKR